MKTKKPKQTQKEKDLEKAYKLMRKHGLEWCAFDKEDFLDEFIYERWNIDGEQFDPTEEELQRAVKIAGDYLSQESWGIMQDAIDKVKDARPSKEEQKALLKKVKRATKNLK